jgi:hypothetical protein
MYCICTAILLQFHKGIVSRISRPISLKLGTNHPLVKRIKNCSKEGPVSFPRGDNHKCKNRVGPFKNLLLKNHRARRAHIYRKAF